MAWYSSSVWPGASRPRLNQSAAGRGMPFSMKQWPSMLQHCRKRGVPSPGAVCVAAAWNSSTAWSKSPISR